MNAGSRGPLGPKHLQALESTLHRGASEASRALGKWIEKPASIEVDSLEQLPFGEATGLLASGDDPICFCSMALAGVLGGQMVLAFPDSSGFALCELVLSESAAGEWDEMAQSIALETTNIVCCAYLNALSSDLPVAGESVELVPSPPQFHRDYAESLLEFALMEQAMTSDLVIVARTRFEIAGEPIDMTLLFAPDEPTAAKLPQLLERGAEAQ